MPSSLQVLQTVQIFGYVYNPLTGNPVPLGTPVTITWKVALGSIASPLVNAIPESQTVTTDANGYWTANVVPPDKLSPINSTYHITDTYNSYDIGGFTLAGMPVGGYQDLNIRVAPAPAVLPPGAQTVGALTVTGLLQAQAGITVTGVTTTQSINASGLITGTAGLTISAGGAAITGNSTVTGTLTVSAALTVQAGGAAITGNSTVTGTLTVSSTLTVTAGGLTVSAGGAAITGNSTVTGTLTVTALLTAQAGLTVSAGGAAITGNSTVTGTLTVTSDLTAQARLLFSTPIAKIIPGATSLSLRNNPDSADNLLIPDNGQAVFRNGLALLGGTKDVGAGTFGYTQVTANQTGITTVVDLTNLSLTVTVSSGRRIRVTGWCLFQSSVADDIFGIFIQEGATILQQGQFLMRPAAASLACLVEAVLQPTAAAHTYKLTAQRLLGTGTGLMQAGATSPAFILVEDIGT